MTKIRLTLTSTVEYKADPINYGTSDPKEMLQIDIDSVSDDPFIIFDGVPFIVTGEIVKEEIPN